MRSARNPHLQVLRTYVRWRFLALALGVPVVTAYQLSLASHDATYFVALLVPSWCLAVPFLSHLREMLQAPRASLTPGVARAHLVVAGTFVGLFAVLIPLGMSRAILGANGPYLAVVAATFATFAAGCFAEYSRPFTMAVVIAYLWLTIFRSDSRSVPFWLPTSVSLSLFVIGMALLAVVAANLTWSGEEAASGRTALESAGRLTGRLLKSIGARPSVYPSRAREKFRALGGAAPGPGERLWRRALHWDAAWGLLRPAIWSGVLIGLLLAAISWYLGRRDSDLWGVFLIFLPFVGFFPSLTLSEPQGRGLLAYEFLRPFGRRDYVRTVSLVSVASIVLLVALVIGIPTVATWAANGRLESVLWGTLAMIGWVPLFLGVGMANLNREESLTALIICVIAYLLYLLLIGTSSQFASEVVTCTVGSAVAVLGLIVMRAAYFSWLDRDVG